MSEPAECILVLDDSDKFDDYVIERAASQFQVHFARTIQEAYWQYVEHPEWYKLLVLNFNLEGNGSKSNFDGIDLALMIDTFAKHFAKKNPDLQMPWLIAFTVASDEDLECFFNLSISAPLWDVIRKEEAPSLIIKQWDSLFHALSVNDPEQFQSLYRKPARRSKTQIEYDDVTLRKLCPTYRESGKTKFAKIATNICKALLGSYRLAKFSALAPGYSGSEVLTVVARRGEDSSDFRTFVIKLCKDGGFASTKLDDEVNNYIHHAKNIQKHVPLLIGPFKIAGWRFIAYEFVSFLGEGIRTFADHLRSVFRNNTPSRFSGTESYKHYEFIFGTVLKEWHLLHNDIQPPPDTHSFYERDQFKTRLEETKAKIIVHYGEIKDALRDNQRRIPLRLFPGQEGLTLTNPFFVVYCLLSKSGNSYYEHFLSNGLVHGDLHSGNILRSLSLATGDPAEWKLIDFANMYEADHLAQDGTRLECDIKFLQIESLDINHRFALEVELASALDYYLSQKLKTVLEMKHWTKQWKGAPNSYKLAARQINDIRNITLFRLRQNVQGSTYSEHIDYTVALLMQSLMFVRYSPNATITNHAWSAACLVATLIDQYSEDKKEQRAKQDSLGQALPINP